MRNIFIKTAALSLSVFTASEIAAFAVPAPAGAQELKLWPALAPGEKSDNDSPILFVFKPEKQTSDSFIFIFPGGCYDFHAIDHEGWKVAGFFNRQGMTAAVLKYRVPRRKGLPKHMAPWQDAQRAVRLARSKAKEWGINPEKIIVLGFSAGGHLALMTATTSQTASYQPIDDLDKLACHVNLAVPVYPAYILEEEANGVSTNKVKINESPMVKDFAFDAKTTPMCIVHGDQDPHYSPLGALAIYHKLRTMNIPAELHVFANTGHGFGTNPTLDPNNKHEGDWLNRVYEAIKSFGFR